MNITFSDIVAVSSALLAVASVVYAKRTVKAAVRANEIALHGDQLKVLRDIVGFSSLLTQKGPSIDLDDTLLFRNAIMLSEFYFRREITRELHRISDLIDELMATNIEWAKYRDSAEQSFEIKAVRYGLCHKIQNACDLAAVSMKREMKLD